MDAPDAGTPGDEPYNVYRYNSKRWDAATGTYDMGFRDYSPGLNRFLSRDTYTGALADLNLSTSPWNNNRYAFTSGNPTTLVELDGHRSGAVDCMSGDAWQGSSGTVHQPTNYQPDDNWSWTEVDWQGTGSEVPDNAFTGLLAYTGQYEGKHAFQPDHRVEPDHKRVPGWQKKSTWNNILNSGPMKLAKGLPAVGALVSWDQNLQEDQSEGRALVETATEAAVGTAVGVAVAGVCGLTALIGCGAAIAGGAWLTAEVAGPAGEWFASTGAGQAVSDFADPAAEKLESGWNWTKDTAGSAWEGTTSFVGGLFS